ncbi:MAG: hypothetical protein LBQ88_20340 [Treponema sp.]|jgi:hypothetical protein|nr:hypothetical protein [Treponema sp.]
MYSSYSDINKALPTEFRKAAEELFPPNGYPAGKEPCIEAAAAFADILGIGAEYRRLLKAEKTGREMRQFLGHFQNNLDLLIQKTWVAKVDVDRKEKLQNQIPNLIAGFERGDYQNTLTEFGAILEELFYLFFGAQSHKEDFSEYIFRVDPQIGLFWWYGTQIGSLKSEERQAGGAAHINTNTDKADVNEDTLQVNKESLRAVLLIGICYLANF